MSDLNNVESKVETLQNILAPIVASFSPQKRRYANDLIKDIIFAINNAEIQIEVLKSKINGFTTKDDYLTEYQKAMDILALFGCKDEGYAIITKQTTKWIFEHPEGLKKPFTFETLIRTHRMLLFFEGIYDRMPESFEELKKGLEND